ncbi:MAG TPA: phytanoyl-CoA dioxygenase family protein [Burkholderiaceae bacterium]
MLHSLSSSAPPLDSFAFARDGFVLLRDCLSPTLIDQQAAAVATYLLRSDPIRKSGARAHPEVLRRRQAYEYRTSGVMTLVHHERLLATLHMLAGERSYPVGIGSPESTQELRTCHACSANGGSPHITAWIALRPITLEAGLSVLPGSHTDNRQCLERLLAEDPELAGTLQQMREEGASLEQWQALESRLLEGMHTRQTQASGQGLRLLALNKGDVLIQQQGLLVNAQRLDSRSCLVVRYSATQLHLNHYFSDSGSLVG